MTEVGAIFSRYGKECTSLAETTAQHILTNFDEYFTSPKDARQKLKEFPETFLEGPFLKKVRELKELLPATDILKRLASSSTFSLKLCAAIIHEDLHCHIPLQALAITIKKQPQDEILKISSEQFVQKLIAAVMNDEQVQALFAELVNAESELTSNEGSEKRATVQLEDEEEEEEKENSAALRVYRTKNKLLCDGIAFSVIKNFMTLVAEYLEEMKKQVLATTQAGIEDIVETDGLFNLTRLLLTTRSTHYRNRLSSSNFPEINALWKQQLLSAAHLAEALGACNDFANPYEQFIQQFAISSFLDSYTPVEEMVVEQEDFISWLRKHPSLAAHCSKTQFRLNEVGMSNISNERYDKLHSSSTKSAATTTSTSSEVTQKQTASVNLLVLSTGRWDFRASSLPSDIFTELFNQYSTHFLGSQYGGKKLSSTHLGTVSLIWHTNTHKKQLFCSTTQASILLLFNNVNESENEGLTLQQILEKFNANPGDRIGPASTLKEISQLLMFKILRKSGDSNRLTHTDVFHANHDTRGGKVKINVYNKLCNIYCNVCGYLKPNSKPCIVCKKSQQIPHNQHLVVDAAIVKFMKQKMEATTEEILNSVRRQHPEVEPATVNHCLSSLVEREYLVKKENTTDTYLYLP